MEKKRLIKKLMKRKSAKSGKFKIYSRHVFVDKGGRYWCRRRKFNRLEAYDISHFAGKETFGAMVVFYNGIENKDEYRLLKLKMPRLRTTWRLAEMIERRFRHQEWPFPDLIVIDGGRP